MGKMELWQLEQMQSLPLELKIRKTELRIREWYDYWGGDVYISFSGGKDSSVLLDIVRGTYLRTPAVFCDTGLEYPEIREFVKQFENVDWISPKMPFKKVIEKYGYPVVSKKQALFIEQYRNTKSEKLRKKRWYGDGEGGYKISEKWKFLVKAPFKISDKCCDVMKKLPFKKYEKQTGRRAMIGTMTVDSDLRMASWIKYGCNAFGLKERQISRPMSFWKEQDVLEYINQKRLGLASVYGEIKRNLKGDLYLTGTQRTGCMFCMFGIDQEKYPNRFQRMYRTHPKQWNYCINKLGCGKVLDHMGIPYDPSGLTGLKGFFKNYLPTLPK